MVFNTGHAEKSSENLKQKTWCLENSQEKLNQDLWRLDPGTDIFESSQAILDVNPSLKTTVHISNFYYVDYCIPK